MGVGATLFVGVGVALLVGAALLVRVGAAVLLGVGIYLFCASIALPLPESTNCTARSESDDALRPGIVAQYLAGRRTRPAYGQTAHISVSRELIDHS